VNQKKKAIKISSTAITNAYQWLHFLNNGMCSFCGIAMVYEYRD